MLTTHSFYCWPVLRADSGRCSSEYGIGLPSVSIGINLPSFPRARGGALLSVLLRSSG